MRQNHYLRLTANKRKPPNRFTVANITNDTLKRREDYAVQRILKRRKEKFFVNSSAWHVPRTPVASFLRSFRESNYSYEFLIRSWWRPGSFEFKILGESITFHWPDDNCMCVFVMVFQLKINTIRENFLFFFSVFFHNIFKIPSRGDW